MHTMRPGSHSKILHTLTWRFTPLLVLQKVPSEGSSRHYAKRALTPRSLKVKLGPRRNYHKGWAGLNSNSVLNVKAVVAVFNQEKALVASRGDYEPSDGTF